jgi:hydrogenase expression/formation protein HypC
MCISYPGRVIDLDGSIALVATDGRIRRATTLAMPEVGVGDWVVVAAGAIVDRLDEADADEISRLLDVAARSTEG